MSNKMIGVCLIAIAVIAVVAMNVEIGVNDNFMKLAEVAGLIIGGIALFMHCPGCSKTCK